VNTTRIARRDAMLFAVSLPALARAQVPTQTLPPARRVPGQPEPHDHDNPARHPYLGMWVTRDGHIRHALLPNGRYDEQRGTRKSAYVGRYWVKGHRIWYVDDTGFTADGEFRDGVLHHGGYVFVRERGAGGSGVIATIRGSLK